MMRYGIGLDIGITSVGWVTVALDGEDNPYRIDKLGCRIFEKAEGSDGSPLAEPRRLARGSRRRLRRHRHRLERIRQLIVNSGVLSQNALDELYSKPVSDIYQVRAEALDRILTSEELTRVLIHIAQRRGFKSNRRSDKNEKDNGKLLTAISDNEALIAKKGYRTIGEMFYKDEMFSECKRNKQENYINTVSRAMVEEEVRIIFSHQQELGNPVTTDELRDKYLEILLSQRSFDEGPGEPSIYAGNQIEKMIGRCVFEKDENRAAKAEYHTQYAILLQNVNHLRINSGYDARPLTEDERKMLIGLAFNTKSLTYSTIRKKLGIGNDEYFSSLSYGNKDMAEVEKAKFNYLKYYQDLKSGFEKTAPGVFSTISEDDLDSIGYALTCFKTEDKTAKYLEMSGIDKDIIDIVLELPNFSGFAAISRKAYKKIIPALEAGMTYDKACQAAGYDFRAHGNNTKYMYLPATADELSDITNPVVRRAVSQTIKVINAIIRSYEVSPVYLNVELARELAKDHNERLRIEKEMEKNRKVNDAVVDRLKNEFHIANPSGQDIVKFKLWQEQDGICPYSLEHLSLERLFEPGYADIDHIIPYSISFNDSYRNKVVVKSSENKQKGNRLPLEYLDLKKAESFTVWVNANIRDSNKRKNLLKPCITEEDRSSFKDRNLNDTKYISRFMLNYISDYLQFTDLVNGGKKHVRAVNGAVTSFLRKRWKINKVREDGDAHHIVDSAVIACVTDGVIKRIADYCRNQEIQYVTNDTDDTDLVVNTASGEILTGFPQPWYQFRDEIIIRSEYNDPGTAIREKKLLNYTDSDIESVGPVFVSRMPKRKVTGAAHKETIKSPKALDEGYLIVTKPLSALKLDADGEIPDYYKPESDKLLYEALKSRLAEYGGSGEEAFKEGTPIFHKPKADGSDGPIVKKVKTLEKSTLNVILNGGKGAAVNDNMVRVDVFFAPEDGYYLVPIYVADTLKHELPNKAIIAFKPYVEWKEMKEENFVFSLYPNDIVKITGKKGYSLKILSKESTLPATKEVNNFFAYYISTGISSASISIINHDKTYGISSLGVKTLTSFEKYQVDVLGNVSRVSKETRQHF